MVLKILKFIRNHGVSWYNTSQRGLITLTYLKGRLILCHETWPEKFANFIFRSKADPFWRSIPASKVLPKSPCPTTLVSVYPFSSAQQQIYDSRRDVGIDLSNFARVRTNRDFSSPKAEWSLPISYRTPYLSQSYDLAAIPPSDGPLALPKLRTLHDRLLLAMMMKPSPPVKIIFDLDSTVLPLYGKQEMARVGYNPKKWDRPSYHPLVCFNGITRKEIQFTLSKALRASRLYW